MLSFFKPKPAPGLPELRLHNTLSGTIERFEPLNGTVKMYNCGPTVYGPQHIGNMRAAVFADTIRRTLVAWGYPLKQVINITDFGHLQGGDIGDDATEDKMSVGLRAEGLDPTLENMKALADKYTQAYFDDLDALGVDRSKIEFPRASEYIPAQIELIKTLEQKGYAYAKPSGVYFDVSRFDGYGKLGGINLEGQRAGARVSLGDKRGPHDFILWKSDEKIGWESPWGRGFPGWHIECTAMVFALLGKQIDIHTGGIEHIPIHHNNEIAQAEAATGKQYVRYWLHNDHITIEGKKISKSLGNTIYVRNLADRGITPRALRYWFLTGHYRSQMNFTWDAIAGAATALRRLSQTYQELPEGEVLEAFMREFYERIADDLGTANALGLVWSKLKDLNKATLRACDEVLGLGLADAKPVAKLTIKTEELPEGIKELLASREAAREHKDFAKADEFRAEIESAGYILKDTPEGPQVSKK